MATPFWRRFGYVWIVCLMFTGTAAPVHADELWVAPTSQADIGGLGVRQQRLLAGHAGRCYSPGLVNPGQPADVSDREGCAHPQQPVWRSDLERVRLRGAEREPHLGRRLCGSALPGLHGRGQPTRGSRHFQRPCDAHRHGRIHLSGGPGVHDADDGDRSHRRPAVPLCGRTPPAGVAGLAANTFAGTQTAPAFVGDGSGLTNLPVPSGVATLGANTFAGTQTAPAFVGSGARG